jgi:hypothetical protein
MADYLPGINVTLNDLGLKVAPPPAGPKVTLLGVTSNPNVRIREPYTISSVEKAMNTLYFDLPVTAVAGTIGEGTYGTNGRVPGELALAIEEAVNAGAPNIEVMIVDILSGQALLDYIAPTIDHTGRYAALSGAYEVLRNRELDVVVPVGAYMDQVFTGTNELVTHNFGKELANFCFRATKESNSAVGVIPVRPPTLWAFEHRAVLGTNPTLSGELRTLFGLTGTILTTGLWRDTFQEVDRRNALAGIHFGVPSASLLNEWHTYHTYTHRADKTSVVGLTNPAGEWSNAPGVYTIPHYNARYVGWLSGAADQLGRTLDNLSETDSSAVSSAYFQSWQAVDSEGVSAVDARGNKVDAGAFINVFAAPLRSTGTLVRTTAISYRASPSNTSINTPAAAAYAGKITSLAPQSSTTNKLIDGLVGLRLLSAKQANDMTGMRLVTMYSRTKGLTVASGVTGAFNVTKYVRSDYVRLTTMRIVAAAADLIRAIGDKYIGEPNNAPQMNALDAEIDQVLLSMKGQGALNSYDFSISSTPDQRVLGQLDINLTLVPAFEIQEINLVVSLSKEL